MGAVILTLIVAGGIGAATGADDPSPRDATDPSTSPASPNPSPTPSAAPPSPEEVKVPKVEGASITKAERTLENAGLRVDVDLRFSEEPKGTVLSVAPSGGSTLYVGDTVSLVVAKPFPKIPNVLGTKLERAKRTLRDAGFEVEVSRQTSSAPKDRVISQSPSGGTRARPGRTVRIVIAKPAPSGGGSGGSNCTPGYSPCIPIGPDVDCAGGSGDGPRYVSGPIRVTGSDPYGLDGDNDGIGCE